MHADNSLAISFQTQRILPLASKRAFARQNRRPEFPPADSSVALRAESRSLPPSPMTAILQLQIPRTRHRESHHSRHRTDAIERDDPAPGQAPQTIHRRSASYVAE